MTKAHITLPVGKVFEACCNFKEAREKYLYDKKTTLLQKARKRSFLSKLFESDEDWVKEELLWIKLSITREWVEVEELMSMCHLAQYDGDISLTQDQCSILERYWRFS